MRHRSVELVLLAILVSACISGDSATRLASPEVRDSAGIRIVTHPLAQWPDTVDDAPILRIGREGDSQYELFRVYQALELSSGNVVVVNGGTSELRFYSPDGQHIRDVGGQGEGPAEFGFLSTAWRRRGDTLAVFDPRRRRVVYFDSAGEFVQDYSFALKVTGDSPPGRNLCTVPNLAGMFADGELAIRGWGCLNLQGSSGMRSWEHALLLSDLMSGDTIVVTTISTWERGDTEDPREMYDFIPFEQGPSTAIEGNRLFVSRGDAYEIEVYGSDGTLLEIWRETGEPPLVTAEMKREYEVHQEELGRPHPQDVPFADRMGGYETLMVSPAGSVWARRAGLPSDAYEFWTVFSPDGSEIRHLVLPETGAVSVRGSRLVGVHADSFGIQQVLVYEVGEH